MGLCVAMRGNDLLQSQLGRRFDSLKATLLTSLLVHHSIYLLSITWQEYWPSS